MLGRTHLHSFSRADIWRALPSPLLAVPLRKVEARHYATLVHTLPFPDGKTSDIRGVAKVGDTGPYAGGVQGPPLSIK